MVQEFSFEVAYETGTCDHEYSFGDVSKQFPLASVTKLFTAFLTLIQIEKNIIDVKEEILPNGATILNLLSHSAGLAFDKYEFINEKEQYRNYSNIGFEIIGEYLTDITSVSYEKLLEEDLLFPLNITGFQLRGNKSPAKDAYASIEDLRLFARQLLQPTLISEKLLRKATCLHFLLPGIYLNTMQEINNHAWGLGFEIKADKQNHWMGNESSCKSFGHFGSSGSFLMIDPDKKIYNIFLGEKSYNAEHRIKWNKLNDELLGKHR